MSGDVSPSKRRHHHRRRSPSTSLLSSSSPSSSALSSSSSSFFSSLLLPLSLALYRPSFSLGALLLLLTVSFSLLLLRREIEDLIELPNDDVDVPDWSIGVVGGGTVVVEDSVQQYGNGNGATGHGTIDSVSGKLGRQRNGGSGSSESPFLLFEPGVRKGGGGGEREVGSGSGKGVRVKNGGGGGGGGGENETQDVTDEDKVLARDVTMVISGKHSFAMTKTSLEEIFRKAPLVPILYVISGPINRSIKTFLIEKEKTMPHLSLLETGNYSSGYSSRNASLGLIKTKYALFIFNDVVPKNRNWLQELYAFAETHLEGMVFAPFIWEKHQIGAHNRNKKGSFGTVLGTRPDWGIQPHVGFTRELTFDDFSNDGKLYIDLQEEETNVDPTELEAREVGSFLEDHCLLIRKDFLQESMIWDPLTGYTRQDVELALTLRYEKKKAYFVPKSEVVYQHPSLQLDPSDISFFASQSNEDICAENIVHLRNKWGIITGQLCRGFVDGVLRTVVWEEGEIPSDFGEQLKMILGMFSLMGLNRYQMRSLHTWIPPPRGPPLACKLRHKKSCPRILKWMETASNAVNMLESLPQVEGALVELQAQLHAGIVSVNLSRGGPQLVMGRMEIQLPLRLNRVVDTHRAYALQSGDLFPVRRGILKRGEKHAGRRAPELAMLTRLYLPFLIVEVELMLSKGGSRGIETEEGLGRVMDGMSLVIKENCLRENDDNGGGVGGGLQKGFLLVPDGRPCHRNEEHYRAFMYVRHLETEPSPARMFMTLKHQLIRGADVRPGGWVNGQSIRKGLSDPLQDTLQRLRVIACMPGDSCSLSLPMGIKPKAWQLLLWAWRPQSVRTAQVLLLQPEMAKITWQM